MAIGYHPRNVVLLIQLPPCCGLRCSLRGLLSRQLSMNWGQLQPHHNRFGCMSCWISSQTPPPLSKPICESIAIARSMRTSSSGPLLAIHGLPDTVSEECVQVLRYGIGLVTLCLRRFQPFTELLQ